MSDTPAGFAGDIDDSSLDYRDLSVLEVAGTIAGAFAVMGLLVLFTTWVERKKEKQHADSIVMETLRNQRQTSHADVQLPSRVMNFKREKTLAMVQRVVEKRKVKGRNSRRQGDAFQELEEDLLGPEAVEELSPGPLDLQIAPSIGSFASLPSNPSPGSRQRRTSLDSAMRKARLAKEIASIRREEKEKASGTPPKSPQGVGNGSFVKNISFDSHKPARSGSSSSSRKARLDNSSDALALLQDDGTTILTTSGSSARSGLPTSAYFSKNSVRKSANRESRSSLEPSMTATRHKSEEQRINHLSAALASLQEHQLAEGDLSELEHL